MAVTISPLLAGTMLLMVAAEGSAAETRQACDATVDITDTDPAGTHVRSAPGGAVVATLSNTGDGWISVHLAAQLGDWYEIDAASLVDSVRPRDLFHGRGYVHKSVLGVSGMKNGGSLYVDADGKRPLVSHVAGDQPVMLLGCRGSFLKVKVGKFTGWTREACTNMNSTCV